MLFMSMKYFLLVYLLFFSKTTKKYVYECFASLSVHGVQSLVPAEVRREYQIPVELEWRAVSHYVGAGKQTRSFERASSTLNL